MVPYVTFVDIAPYLDQVDMADPDTQNFINTLGVRATAQIDRKLEFSFQGYAEAAPKVAFGTGSPWLKIQPHKAGTVATVTPETDTTTVLTGWVEDEDGSLFLSSPELMLLYPYFYLKNPYSYEPGWAARRFLVTAQYGYGDPPEDIKEVAVELAVNMWKEKDRGMFSNAIGVQGDGGQMLVGYQGAFTARQKMVIQQVRSQFRQEGWVVG